MLNSMANIDKGNDYTGGTQFVSGGSAAALATVTNLDGSTDNLSMSQDFLDKPHPHY